MCNQIIDIYFSIHIPVDNSRYLCSTPGTTKSSASPHSASHHLKRPGGYLSTCRCDTNNDTFAPALVAALQRLALYFQIADTLNAVVCTAPRKIDQMRNQVTFYLVRIYKMGYAELFTQRLTLGI